MDTYLFIITYRNDVEEFHKTPATPEAIQAAEKAGAEITGYDGCDHQIAPFDMEVDIDAFKAQAGDIPLEQVSLEDFLAATGADGVDVFY